MQTLEDIPKPHVNLSSLPTQDAISLSSCHLLFLCWDGWEVGRALVLLTRMVSQAHKESKLYPSKDSRNLPSYHLFRRRDRNELQVAS